MQTDFYASYGNYKRYQAPILAKKDIARFDAEIWVPASFSNHMTCLEIGCDGVITDEPILFRNYLNK